MLTNGSIFHRYSSAPCSPSHTPVLLLHMSHHFLYNFCIFPTSDGFRKQRHSHRGAASTADDVKIPRCLPVLPFVLRSNTHGATSVDTVGNTGVSTSYPIVLCVIVACLAGCAWTRELTGVWAPSRRSSCLVTITKISSPPTSTTPRLTTSGSLRLLLSLASHRNGGCCALCVHGASAHFEPPTPSASVARSATGA